jgi:hypothetical protein
MDRLFIPTVNRVDNQITLSQIPKSYKNKVTLVVQQWERQKYNYDVDYLVLPKNVNTDDYLCLAKTRKIIYEEAKKLKYGVLDDDLTFARRNQKRFGLPSNMEKTSRICNEEDMNEMLNLYSSWLDHKDITFTGGCRFSLIPSTKEYHDNGPVFSQLFLNGPDFADRLHDFPLTEVRYNEDVLFLLSLLARGYGSRISQTFGFHNASLKGKLTDTVWADTKYEDVWKDVTKIQNLYPDFVKVPLDKNGNRIKGGFRNYGKMQVYWKKCYNSSQEKKPVTNKINISKLQFINKSKLPNQPKYPLYVVSKGRWDTRLTSEALCGQEVQHNIVIENQEYKQYKNNINHKYAKLLVLDPKYQDEYDTCDDLGDTKSKGPGAARNFAWEHSIDNGHDWHWVMDDNINLFIRFNMNRYIPTYSGGFWRAMEDFMCRYENVAMGGPEYYMFITRRKKYKPFRLNTRIYSCNFIRNDVPFRWRGRYNEDTILSLDMLKEKWCTMIFHTFLQWKLPTQTVKGGNTKEFYEKEGTLAKSKMQVAVHPDVSELVWKYNRWHHKVDYARFKTVPKLKKGIVIPKGNNEYGMTIKQHRER